MFFAGSDDEDIVLDTHPSPAIPEETMAVAEATQRPRSPTQKPLFFADSDEDEPVNYRPQHIVPPQDMEDDAGIELDVDMPEFVEVPRASSVSSTSSGMYDSHSSSSPPPPVRQHSEGPPSKKRRLSPVDHVPAPGHESMYLGYFLVDNAWSTVKGFGYIKPGDEIRIEREEPNPPPPPKKPAKKDKGKDGKKQLTIANMFKPAPAKPNKKKQDTVVRITNSRGFGMCRIHQRSHFRVCLTARRIWPPTARCCVLGIQTSGPWYVCTQVQVGVTAPDCF